jgi:hypothetical protein
MAFKIMNKDYHLVNAAGDKVVIHPKVLTGYTDTNCGGLRATTPEGLWVRQFTVDQTHEDFKAMDTVTVTYKATDAYPTVEANGNIWTMAPIAGLNASRPRKNPSKKKIAAATTEAEATPNVTKVETEVVAEAPAEA